MSARLKKIIAWFAIGLVKLVMLLFALAGAIFLAIAIEEYMNVDVIYWSIVGIGFACMAANLLLAFALHKLMILIQDAIYTQSPS